MNYALIETATGTVANIVVWDGNAETWQPPEGHTAVEVPEGVYVSIGTRYENGEFVPPEPPAVIPPSPEQNAATRDTLLSIAAVRIAPLQDAADLDEASAAELATLRAWKQYRVALNRVDLSAPVWPQEPEA